MSGEGPGIDFHSILGAPEIPPGIDFQSILAPFGLPNLYQLGKRSKIDEMGRHRFASAPQGDSEKDLACQECFGAFWLQFSEVWTPFRKTFLWDLRLPSLLASFLLPLTLGLAKARIC